MFVAVEIVPMKTEEHIFCKKIILKLKGYFFNDVSGWQQTSQNYLHGFILPEEMRK